MDSQAFFDNYRIPKASNLIIFGASGNLAARKIFPALFHLFSAGRLSPKQHVVGFSRTPMTDEEFRSRMKENVKKMWEADEQRGAQPAPSTDGEKEADSTGVRISTESSEDSCLPESAKRRTDIQFSESTWNEFEKLIFYHRGDGRNPYDYSGLAGRIKEICRCKGLEENLLLYLATPPEAYHPIIENIEKTRFLEEFNGWSRIVVEKPFGSDLESANELNKLLYKSFTEDQIYRIDHYLGKETVQNILIFRFANGILEPIWNRRYIDHVQILIAESQGIEKRGGYYEKAGAMKDMIQNHMLQLLALTAMEPPISFESNAIRDEKVKAIRSIHPIDCETVGQLTARGQYSTGEVNGINVPGYREEANVAPDSMAETYAALRINIENWRWAGVPFYLRTGKRLPTRVTEIAIFFKRAPLLLFRNANYEKLDPNMLVLRIQPDEGIFLRFGVKVPGTDLRIGGVNMNFSYKEAFRERSISAYERLLLDFMLGDSSLFARRDGINAMWRFADSVTVRWHHCDSPDFPNYKAGIWGPKGADDLINRDGRAWRIPGVRGQIPQNG